MLPYLLAYAALALSFSAISIYIIYTILEDEG